MDVAPQCYKWMGSGMDWIGLDWISPGGVRYRETLKTFNNKTVAQTFYILRFTKYKIYKLDERKEKKEHKI